MIAGTLLAATAACFLAPFGVRRIWSAINGEKCVLSFAKKILNISLCLLGMEMFGLSIDWFCFALKAPVTFKHDI